MDLKDHLDIALDAAADGAPAPRPVQIPLYAGRRALRRRRLATAAGSMAVVAALGVPVALLAGGTGVTGEDAPPLSGSPAPTAPSASTDEWVDEVPVGLPDEPLCGDHLAELPTGPARLETEVHPEPCLSTVVGFDNEGNLRRAPGVVVSGLVTDLPPAGPQDESTKRAAIEATHEGKRYFIHLAWEKGGASEGQEPAVGTFEAWVQKGLDGYFGGISSAGPDEITDPGDQVWWTPDGEFRAPAGVTVVRTVGNPLRLTSPNDSKGVEFEIGGVRYWALTWQTVASANGGRGGSSWTAVEDAMLPDFDTWLTEQVKLQHGEKALQLVELAPDGTLRALPGVRLVRQVANPELGDDFAPAGVPTAAAEVVWEGRTWFVLARDLADGPPDYIVASGPNVGATLDEFLEGARERYRGGEGLR